MEVFCVVEFISYDKQQIFGFYSTLEKARAAASARMRFLVNEEGNDFSTLSIYRGEVDSTASLSESGKNKTTPVRIVESLKGPMVGKRRLAERDERDTLRYRRAVSNMSTGQWLRTKFTNLIARMMLAWRDRRLG